MQLVPIDKYMYSTAFQCHIMPAEAYDLPDPLQIPDMEIRDMPFSQLRDFGGSPLRPILKKKWSNPPADQGITHDRKST